MAKSITVNVLTLGCPKNLVDSEYIMGYLRSKGFGIVTNLEDADVVIVNTCAFLQEAVKESLGEIKELVEKREEGSFKVLAVTGCLIERYKEDIFKFLDGVDVVFSIDHLKDLEDLFNRRTYLISRHPQRFLGSKDLPRYNPIETPYSYLKISEGCNRMCSFCIIPQIRGKMRSRTFEDIIDEAKKLLDLGKKELIVVSQDPTSYGFDLYGKGYHFITLLEKLDNLEGEFWIRLLYLHPSGVSKELVDFLSTSHNVVPYIDVPIQHVSSRILKLMKRTGGRKSVEDAISIIRERLPHWYIRTEIIVGFPSETDEEFTDLLNFLEEFSFERVAVFPFSPEPESPASNLSKMLPPQLINDRYEVARITSENLSFYAQKRLIGKNLEILVEDTSEGYRIGRTFYDAPEIDFGVRLKFCNCSEERIVICKVIGVNQEYDLEAVCNEGV